MYRDNNETKASSSHRPNPLVEQLLTVFPGGDPDYFQSCLAYYHERHVERIAEKICASGGHYPTVPSHCLSENEKRLNYALNYLATELFPDCDVGYLRDKVLGFTHSHIEQTALALLQEEVVPERLESGKIRRCDFIHSEAYKLQAQTQLVVDFPQIWKSSVRAVLAENNWDYTNSFHQLTEMGSGSFWKSVRNFFLHWSLHRPPKQSALIKNNLTKELESELNEMRKGHLDLQAEQDERIAHGINEAEYTTHQQLMTCLCCYGDFTFEQVAFCSEGKHTFCHSCVNRFISEGLFGQGSLRGTPRIKCIALTECHGCLSSHTLQHVLSKDLWTSYEKSLMEEDIKQACQTMIQCPNCTYGELDESIRPFQDLVTTSAPLFRIARWIMVVTVTLSFYYSSSYILLAFLTTLQWFIHQQWDLESDLKVAYERIAQGRRGHAFQCRSPECGKLSCLRCKRVIRGLHNCTEQEQDGLRLYVEKAMADAVKRTCPNCNLSFQKEDGCNKILCRCGYAMCYVCRKDIGKESYAHFCEHFRIVPGRACQECNKCDLYKTDPEDEAVYKAEASARKEYLLTHPDMAKKLSIEDAPIGPMTTIEKMNSWRRQKVLSILQQGIDIYA